MSFAHRALLSISWRGCLTVTLATLGACMALRAPEPVPEPVPTQPADASPPEQRVLGGATDYSRVTPRRAHPQELPTWKVPNIASAAEAYYAPDSYHLIAQVQDPDAAFDPNGRSRRGSLTWVFADEGRSKWRINDRGQDACSYFFPNGKRLVFTSTRDHPELPLGNWSDERNYPQGAELYSANIDGSDRRRLTNNTQYEAEVSVSPDVQRIAFTRQVDGALDLYIVNADGIGERQLTHTPDWQEGAPFFLPDGKTLTTRA